mmetsp:Transcript_128404/g.369738  ORF Transcript_128404/g.369738 Transcript_128404/m.369738 type:complete len:81 (-) Transcript_128404:329-571(-)
MWKLAPFVGETGEEVGDVLAVGEPGDFGEAACIGEAGIGVLGDIAEPGEVASGLRAAAPGLCGILRCGELGEEGTYKGST